MAALAWVLRIVSWLLLVLFVVGLLTLFVPPTHPFREAPLLREFGAILNSWAQALLSAAGGTINGDLARFVLLALFLVGNRLSAAGARRADIGARYRRFSREYETLKKQHNLSDDDPALTPVQMLLTNLKEGRLTDRGALLSVFAETKRKLDEIGRDLAFLSLDIVDSTGLKKGEEKAAVEHDFKEFNAWVDTIFRESGAIKTSWTPDGAMAAFSSTDEAVEAAKRVLGGLSVFNSKIKVMRRNFAVRCGVNAGYVYFEPDAPLELLSDRVLDVAAHLQRQAAPNTLCVARPVIEPLRMRQGFIETGRTVQGYEVFEWKG